MMLKHYRKEFRRPPNPSAKHLRCVAYLDENISDVLPYLNTVLKGHQYITDPPSLTLKFNGKLITLYAKEIGINIVKDEDEAEKILKWLKKEINDTWKRRDRIKPSFSTATHWTTRTGSIRSSCSKPPASAAGSMTTPREP